MENNSGDVVHCEGCGKVLYIETANKLYLIGDNLFESCVGYCDCGVYFCCNKIGNED